VNGSHDAAAERAYRRGIDPLTLAEIRTGGLIDIAVDVAANPDDYPGWLGPTSSTAIARRALALVLGCGWTLPEPVDRTTERPDSHE
jgi:hypothetical protein